MKVHDSDNLGLYTVSPKITSMVKVTASDQGQGAYFALTSKLYVEYSVKLHIKQ